MKNKIISFCILIAILIFINLVQANTVDRDYKKIEVLKNLSANGSVEAMQHLAKIYIHSPDKELQNKAVHLFLRAAALGYKPGLLAFGTQLANPLNSDETIFEGLTLIAIAELHGQHDAYLSMLHLPDMLGTEQGLIDSARKEAVKRVLTNQLLSKTILKEYNVSLTASEKRFIRVRMNKIRQKLKIKKNTNIEKIVKNNIETHRKILADKKIIHTEKLEKQLHKNKLRNESNSEATSIVNTNSELDQNIQKKKDQRRIALREQGAASRINAFSDKDKKKLEEQLITVLEQVNRHRATEAILIKEQLLTTIK